MDCRVLSSSVYNNIALQSTVTKPSSKQVLLTKMCYLNVIHGGHVSCKFYFSSNNTIICIRNTCMFNKYLNTWTLNKYIDAINITSIIVVMTRFSDSTRDGSMCIRPFSDRCLMHVGKCILLPFKVLTSQSLEGSLVDIETSTGRLVTPVPSRTSTGM